MFKHQSYISLISRAGGLLTLAERRTGGVVGEVELSSVSGCAVTLGVGASSSGDVRWDGCTPLEVGSVSSWAAGLLDTGDFLALSHGA